MPGAGLKNLWNALQDLGEGYENTGDGEAQIGCG